MYCASSALVLVLLHIAAAMAFLLTQCLLQHNEGAPPLKILVSTNMEGRGYAAEKAEALVFLSHRKLKVEYYKYAGGAAKAHRLLHKPAREEEMESLEAAHSDEWIYYQPIKEEWLREWAKDDPLYEPRS